jgi:hypothetical protein
MARDKTRHPLCLFFGARRFTHDEAMNWLQERGHIADECVTAEDVAPSDAHRILTRAGALWAWSERYFTSGKAPRDQYERLHRRPQPIGPSEDE